MTDLTLVKAQAEQEVIKTNIGDRMLGSMVDIALNQETSEAGTDLAADLFWQNYKFKPEYAETVAPERQVNQRLLKWLEGVEAHNQSRQSLAGDMLASQMAAGTFWSYLQKESILKDALKAQEEAEKAAKQAQQAQAEQQLAEQASQQARENGKKELADQLQAQAEQAGKQAKKAQAALAKASQKANDALDGLEGNVPLKATAGKASKQATKQAIETKESMRGWGVEGGTLETVNQFNQLNTEHAKKISDIAGRVEGIASNQRKAQKPDGFVPTEVVVTQDIEKIFPEELAKLHPSTDPFIRFDTAMQWLDIGLMGWEYTQPAKERGDFVMFGDRSGSMGIQNMLTMLGCALGMGRVAKAENRRYLLGTFNTASGGIPVVTSEQSWVEHMTWANQGSSGGTDFNLAINEAIKALEAMGSKTADFVFVTDGIARISPQTVTNWKEFAERTGARLLFVPVNEMAANSPQIVELADQVVALDHLDEEAIARATADFMR